MPSIIPRHTLIEKRCWNFVSTVPCGFSWDHQCELRVLLIPLWVKVASSVNNINGSNWQLVGNQWQNSRSNALSPGCRFCTGCGWNGYKPSSCNVCHTRARETPRCVESLRMVVVGLCCTISRMFSCSSMFCLQAHSDETWALGSIPHSGNVLNILTLYDLEFCA